MMREIEGMGLRQLTQGDHAHVPGKVVPNAKQAGPTNARRRMALLADSPEALPMLQEWCETAWESYDGPHGPGGAANDLVS
jgi:hypothetical protein